MSGHTSRGVTRDEALPQRETPPRRILWRYGDGPRLVSDAADDESLPPWCDTVPASGPRSLRSDRQPLPLYPGRDMSIHTLKGVARDDALL